MSSVIIQETSEHIPVSKILCVGANYRDHIMEMTPGQPPVLPTEPVLFMKPPSAIIHDGESIVKPPVLSSLHHEVELVVVIGDPGRHIAAERADAHVLGYAVGLDMTLRDLQSEAKKKGRPWTTAKGFDTSAVVSAVRLKQSLPDPENLELRLWVNDVLRQQGRTSEMLFKVAEIVAYASKFFTLCRGDLIFTGTPPGVGPVQTGDRLKAEIQPYLSVAVSVA